VEKIAYLFAGQGTQYVGMGRDLYESFPESKAVFDQADKVLGFSLSSLCFEGPKLELTKTQNCQPAILAVSIAAYEAFKSAAGCRLQAAGYAAGLSLGEYSALVAAGAISFEDAVYLVRQRGEFMEEAAAKLPGKMLSIIGLAQAQVKQVCLETNTEIANINCPGQIVISGGVKEIEQAKHQAEELGAKMAVVLEVSGAFHSSFMREVTLKLAKELEKIKINPPVIPVVCNVTGKEASSPVEIRDNLIKQVESSVLWEDSMKFILSKGVMNFIEFGPGKVLKGLMRRIDPNAQVITIEKKEGIIALQQDWQGTVPFGDSPL
jgi:[acyl-carrier-protein] S-malonyltransferase